MNESYTRGKISGYNDGTLSGMFGAMDHANEKREQARAAARREEQRKIKARGEALGEDVRGETDLLTGGLETGGWSGVAQAEFAHCLVDGRNLFPCALAAPVLIAVQGRPAGVLAQQL